VETYPFVNAYQIPLRTSTYDIYLKAFGILLDVEKQEQIFKQMRANEKMSPISFLSLIDTYSKIGKTEECITLVVELKSIYPLDSFLANKLLHSLLAGESTIDFAVQEYEELKTQQGFIITDHLLTKLISLLIKLNRSEAATRIMESYTGVSPFPVDNARFDFMIVEEMFKSGDTDKAMLRLQEIGKSLTTTTYWLRILNVVKENSIREKVFTVMKEFLPETAVRYISQRSIY